MPQSRRLPDASEIARLNAQLRGHIAAGNDHGIRRLFEDNTPAFVMMDPGLMRSALRAIDRATPARPAASLPLWMPRDLMALSPGGFRRAMANGGYGTADINRAFTARTACARRVEKLVIPEGADEWHRLQEQMERTAATFIPLAAGAEPAPAGLTVLPAVVSPSPSGLEVD